MLAVLKLISMKTSKKQTNPVIIMFWSMPSCSMLKAYKEKCDMLNQAIREVKSVEVVTQGNEVLKLNRIGNESGKFFGLKSIKKNAEKMLLNINHIKMVTLL
jgi:recombinational DNA repair protein RecR